MTVTLLKSLCRIPTLSFLTGPIFDKELRVSSRRRRNYVLRFVYLALLTIFLALVWFEEVSYSGAAVYTVSRMARAGQSIILTIVWFQFCATQLAAIIMLSTSISDEIYHRTLGVLMTTPINAFQIVMGKLFSKLLQLILLLAIGMPLLAIVRVFGGVPWNYVLSSVCITLATIIFVGSVTLFFSIFSRRAYVVIIVTILVLGVIFALTPILVFVSLHDVISEKQFFSFFSAFNPYFLLAMNTDLMVTPRWMGPVAILSWPGHCGIMLAASAIILAFAVILVRRAALRQAAGEPAGQAAGDLAEGKTTGRDGYTVVVTMPRRVKGPPVLWKELRYALFKRHRIAACVIILAALAVLLITYGLCAKERALDESGPHILYGLIFMGLGILFTTIIPASSITFEKESRAWPLLLATTLNDWQIVLGKFIGALRRCGPIWLFLFGHIVIFTLSGIIRPICIVQMAIVVAGVVVFLTGSGLYFSARLRNTTAAVIANFAFAATIWAVVPLLIALIFNIAHYYEPLDVYLDTNPFVQTGVVMNATARAGIAGIYYRPNYEFATGPLNAEDATVFLLSCMVVYVFLGFIFTFRAKSRLRRNIF